MKTKAMYKTVCLVAVLFVFVGIAASGCSHQKTAPATPTLYERLGGSNNIALVVADVIDRAYEDPVFAANPRIHEAHKRFPKAIYKYNATNLACHVMGGPQVYTGRSLEEAHKHLHVSEKEWQQLIKIFRESMTSFKVPQREQNEIIAIIESTKGQILASADEK